LAGRVAEVRRLPLAVAAEDVGCQHRHERKSRPRRVRAGREWEQVAAVPQRQRKAESAKVAELPRPVGDAFHS